MIKKGIILAGGTGSRLSPLTKSVNKQLLPVYDKPLIFYPLSVLMMNNIKNILIIVNKGQIDKFRKILPEKNNLGIKIKYSEQKKPKGLPDAFIIGKNFLKNENVVLILGDNFFHSSKSRDIIFNNLKFKNGAKIFISKVKNPKQFGIVKVNKKSKVLDIQEKPNKPKTNLAITGLYIFDKYVSKFSKNLKPSKRKELEIADLLKIYQKKNMLKAQILKKGIKWLDAGSINDLINTTNYVKNIEKNKRKKIACLEEISLKKKWIGIKEIKRSIKFYGDCHYSKFLKRLIKR